jgi:hypothetical protein
VGGPHDSPTSGSLLGSGAWRSPGPPYRGFSFWGDEFCFADECEQMHWIYFFYWSAYCGAGAFASEWHAFSRNSGFGIAEIQRNPEITENRRLTMVRYLKRRRLACCLVMASLGVVAGASLFLLFSLLWLIA